MRTAQMACLPYLYAGGCRHAQNYQFLPRFLANRPADSEWQLRRDHTTFISVANSVYFSIF
jgi:hypothetical protein